MRVLVAGGAGFIGCQPVRPAPRPRRRGGLRRQPRHRVGRQRQGAWPSGGLLLRRGRRQPTRSRSTGRFDAVVNLACPASPADFGPLALEILEVGSRGVANLLDLARAQRRPLPPGVDQRGVRRAPRPPPARDLLGQRQPHRARVGLRRGQALRRGAHHGLPPPARPGGRHRPDLQHLRSGHARRRRPGDLATSSPRPSGASRSPSTATARRPAASATWTTWLPGCWPCWTPPHRTGQHRQRRRARRCSRWLSWCWSCPVPRRGSSSRPDRPTIPSVRRPDLTLRPPGAGVGTDHPVSGRAWPAPCRGSRTDVGRCTAASRG